MTARSAPAPLERASPPTDRGQPEVARYRRLALLALVAGIVLRLTGLGIHSLWYDELMTLHVATAPDMIETLKGDRHPPLFHAFVRGWIRVFGEGDVALRVLPALISCGTLLVLARVASRFLSPGAAGVAIALQALSPFSIWYGQELRAYGMLELAACIAWLGALRYLSGAARPMWNLALVALACAIGFGAHYMAVTLCAPLVLLALIPGANGSTFKRAAVLLAAAGVGFAPWIPWMLTILRVQVTTPWGYTTNMAPRDLIELPVRLLLVEPDVLPPALVYAFGALVLVALAVCTWRALAGGERAARIALACAAGPILAALAIALLFKPSFTPRYLIAAAPGVVLASAIGLASMPLRALRIASATYALLFCLTLTLAHRRQSLKEDFRTACAEVVANWRPGDRVCSVIGTGAGWSEASLDHYLRPSPDVRASLEPEIELLAERLEPGTRVHVVYRDAPYARDYLARLLERSQVEHEGPRRCRVQYWRIVAR